jgi:hypothetical protein
MMVRTLFALVLAGGVALPAAAFSPGPPRPIPTGVSGVCSDGQPPQSDPTGSCGVAGNACNPGAVCLVDPATETILATARGVLTLIVDEDVAGFLENADASAGRLDNARLTALFELTRDGVPVALAETFQLDRVGDPNIVTCEIDPAQSSLCVPSWREPLTEENLIATTSDIKDLGLQWATVDANLTNGLRAALLTPAQLVANPNALVLLEVIDGVRDGFGAFTTEELARLDQFDHTGDGLASVRRFKVTIQVVAP